MEIGELIAAKELFFRSINIEDDNSRKRPLVYARAAFAAAFRAAGPSRLGAVVGRNHASVIHYLKIHDQLKDYEDYRALYERAKEFRKDIMNGEDLPFLTHRDLVTMIQELRNELRIEKQKAEELYIYKEKFFKLKEFL
jgi:tetratricopeptide (TPR) repeat protein